MDEANTKSAGKKAARKPAPASPKGGGNKVAVTRPRKPAASGPGFTASPSPERMREVSPVPISPEERHRLIAEAAYYRASRRGFNGGAEVEDWLAAEAEVDNQLLGR